MTNGTLLLPQSHVELHVDYHPLLKPRIHNHRVEEGVEMQTRFRPQPRITLLMTLAGDTPVDLRVNGLNGEGLSKVHGRTMGRLPSGITG